MNSVRPGYGVNDTFEHQNYKDDGRIKMERYKKWFTSLAVLSAVLFLAVIALAAVVAIQTKKTNQHGAPIQAAGQPLGLAARQQGISSRWPDWPAPSSSPLNVFRHVAVVSDNGLCAEVGRNIMLAGGNAVDAIIATNLCQGSTNSQSSGIGGGFFLTVYNRTSQKCTVIDAREVAGEKANEDMYNRTLHPNLPRSPSQQGWLSIGVPGEIHGLRTAWEQFGSLPWKSLFEPSIDLLETGFPASGSFAGILNRTAKSLRDPKTALDVYINPETNKPYKEGEIIRRPVYAKTLRALAESDDPIQLYYKGYIAQSIVEDMQNGGGIITAKDLANYKSNLHRDPIKVEISSDFSLCGPRPPSSTAVIAGILKILQKYKLTPSDLETVDKGTHVYHIIIEAFKYAYGARSELGDPAFAPSANKVAETIISDAWASKIKGLITDHAKDRSEYHFNQYGTVEDHGTTHMNAVDRNGNGAALTATVNFYFGSKRRSRTTGIIYNDQMDDFSQPGKTNGFGLPASPENYIRPGKRPQSSMSPLVIFNHKTGEPKLIAGASGGSRIISSVAYVATRILNFNETIKEAVDAPRLHDQLDPHVTKYQDGFPENYAKLLTTKYGQNMKRDNPREISVVTAIERSNGKWTANSDYRKPGGYAAGF